MRLLCAALGIISLLLVPSASADYSFGFSTRSHLDHAGASGSGRGALASEGGAGSFGLGDEAGLASAASLDGASPHGGARNSDAFVGDDTLDCFNSTSLVADAPRPTATCWLVALAAPDSSVPLTEKATDPYAIAGGQDWTSAYPPNGFGGAPEPPQSNGDSRSSGGGGGGSAGAPAVWTSDDRDTSSGQSSGGTTEPFHFHSGSDGRGDEILALGQAQSADGSDSPPHHHFHTGDTSTTPIDSTSLVVAGSVVPTHHHARDPIAITIDSVAPTHHVRDPVVTTTADIVGATAGLDVVADTTLTGPSVNFLSTAADPVPEPGTLVLVGLALVAIAFVSKRNSR